jgi:hypothetical protein
MRLRIIVPGAAMVCLLLWLGVHPHKAEVASRVMVKAVAPEPSAVNVREDFQIQTVVPEKAVPAEMPEELVRAKLQAWDDDDRPDLREQRIQELAALLDGTNGLEIIQNVPANLMGYVFAVPSVREQLMANPGGALDWMSQHPNVQSQLQTFLQDWSQSDKNAMQQTIAALPSGPWREKVVAAAVNEALTTDSPSAVALAMQMNVAPQQNASLDMAMTEWAKQDPVAAAQLADQTGDVAVQQQLLKDIATGVAASNPQQAADFALQSIPDGQARDDSIGDIAWAWALQDPASAGTWLAQLPDGAMRQSALQNVMSVWGNHDPNAAITWVENLSPGTLQSQAASDLLPAVSPQ